MKKIKKMKDILIDEEYYEQLSEEDKKKIDEEEKRKRKEFRRKCKESWETVREEVKECRRLFEEKKRRFEDGQPTKNPGDGLLLAPFREPREVYGMNYDFEKKIGLDQQMKEKLYRKYI